jgi:DNA-binding transcriptional regulator/RsmH inhibitor MraZ
MDSQRYKGFQKYKMDPKNRVSVRPAWRPEPGESLTLLYSKHDDYDLPLVKVLTREAYDEKLELIRNSAMKPAKKTKVIGILAMRSSDVQINDQGKLPVPREVCERAGISAESDVFLVGRGHYFEIWSAENFDKVLEIESTDIADDDEELAELGIF